MSTSVCVDKTFLLQLQSQFLHLIVNNFSTSCKFRFQHELLLTTFTEPNGFKSIPNRWKYKSWQNKSCSQTSFSSPYCIRIYYSVNIGVASLDKTWLLKYQNKHFCDKLNFALFDYVGALV